MVLGFLGAGHLASYTVAGLRAAGDKRRILLSPRNTSVAAQLAQQHNCEVAPSNQSLVDGCDIVLLSVRPHQYQELLDGLQFKSGQLVISAMAGVSHQQLSQLPNLQDVQLVRSLPIQCAGVGAGPVPIFPANDTAFALLDQLGTAVVLGDEEQFETAVTIGCMHGWVYQWLAAMSNWATEQGLDAKAAGELTTAAVAGAVAYSQSQGPLSMQTIGDGIAGEGTYTLKGLKHLQAHGAFEAWTGAMDLVDGKGKS